MTLLLKPCKPLKGLDLNFNEIKQGLFSQGKRSFPQHPQGFDFIDKLESAFSIKKMLSETFSGSIFLKAHTALFCNGDEAACWGSFFVEEWTKKGGWKKRS